MSHDRNAYFVLFEILLYCPILFKKYHLFKMTYFLFLMIFLMNLWNFSRRFIHMSGYLRDD